MERDTFAQKEPTTHAIRMRILSDSPFLQKSSGKVNASAQTSLHQGGLLGMYGGFLSDKYYKAFLGYFKTLLIHPIFGHFKNV